MDKQDKQITKVAFVINKITLAGGAERVICTLASEFARRGIETTIFTQQSTDCGYPLDEAVQVKAASTNMKIPGLRNFVRNLKMRKLIKQYEPNVVVSFLTPINLQTILFTRGLKCKVVVSDRIYPATKKKHNLLLSKLIYPLADGYVFQTKEARACYTGKINRLGCVIYNPLIKDLPNAIVPSYEKYITTVGRLTNQKNHTLLIRAFAEFSKNHPDYSLKIYGNGPLKEQLQQLAAELGISDKVHFMGTVENVPSYIRDASMFVLSSDYEGMPNVLAEAMAMGLPCVATDCLGGGAAALIRDGENGLLVPCKDVQSLCAAMEKLADNAQLANALADRAKKKRTDLSVESITQQWIDYCQGVL